MSNSPRDRKRQILHSENNGDILRIIQTIKLFDPEYWHQPVSANSPELKRSVETKMAHHRAWQVPFEKTILPFW